MPMLEIVITGLCALLFHGPPNQTSYDRVELLLVDTSDSELQSPERPAHVPQLSFRVQDYAGPDRPDFQVLVSPRGEEVGVLPLAGAVNVRPLAAQASAFSAGWIGHPFGPPPSEAMDWVPALSDFGLGQINTDLGEGSGIAAKVTLPAGALTADRIVLSSNSDEPAAIRYTDAAECPSDGDTHFIANAVVLRVPLHPEEKEVRIEIDGDPNSPYSFHSGREQTLRLAITNLPGATDLPAHGPEGGMLIEHLRWYGVLAADRESVGPGLEYVKVPCMPPLQSSTTGICPLGRSHQGGGP